MQPIPQNLLATFEAVLKQRNIPIAFRSDYRKWARYFFDFQEKYAPREDKAIQVKLFADKLQSKGQTALQIEQTADAVSLLFKAESEGKPYALPGGAESAGPKATAPKNRHERIEARNPSAGGPATVFGMRSPWTGNHTPAVRGGAGRSSMNGAASENPNLRNGTRLSRGLPTGSGPVIILARR